MESLLGRRNVLRTFTLLLLSSFVASQLVLPTQPPVPSAHTTLVTLTVTENLFPSSSVEVTFSANGTTNAFTEEVPTIYSTETATGLAATATTLFYYGLQEDEVAITPGYSISLRGESIGPPICYFPTSGQWSLIPRILFYLTLFFALVARKHEWLIGGALAAALSYSSLATLQISFQIWTRGANAEMDMLPITGILAASCIIAVPLMNWSSTIQQLGMNTEDETEHSAQSLEPKHKIKKKKEYGPARVVLVFWSLIVMVGFLSGFYGVLMAIFWQDSDWASIVWIPETESIFCAPSSGRLDTTAGQSAMLNSFWINSDFISANNCIDPCSTSASPNTTFRSANELQTFNLKDLIHFFKAFGALGATKKEERAIHFVGFYFGILALFLVFIIVQGVLHIFLFWKSTPHEARWKVYRWLLSMQHMRLNPKRKTRSLYLRYASMIAWMFYISAAIVLVFSPAMFIITIVATEIALAWMPQSEDNRHVDQWGVFAITILVLLAAVISRVAPDVRRKIEEENLEKALKFYQDRSLPSGVSADEPEPQLQEVTIRRRFGITCETMFKLVFVGGTNLLQAIRYHSKDHKLRFAYEWHLARKFWDNPDEEPLSREAEPSGCWLCEEDEDPDEEFQRRKFFKLKKDVKAAKEQYERLQRTREPEMIELPSRLPAHHRRDQDEDRELLLMPHRTRVR